MKRKNDLLKKVIIVIVIIAGFFSGFILRGCTIQPDTGTANKYFKLHKRTEERIKFITNKFINLEGYNARFKLNNSKLRKNNTRLESTITELQTTVNKLRDITGTILTGIDRSLERVGTLEDRYTELEKIILGIQEPD